MISQTVQSPVGPLKITVEDGFVTGIEFFKGNLKSQESACIHETDSDNVNILNQAISELNEYFAGRLRRFTVPIKLSGTPFQRQIWRAMQKIGYGNTKTYRELAEAAGSPRAARAVGNACAANPVAIIVPCHRVLAQDGLGGFGGGIEAKGWLLNLENSTPEGTIE